MAGWRKMLEVWPACLTAGGTFALAQFLVSNFHGPWVVDIAGALFSILALIVLLRFWQPPTVWRFEHESGSESASSPTASGGERDESVATGAVLAARDGVEAVTAVIDAPKTAPTLDYAAPTITRRQAW